MAFRDNLGAQRIVGDIQAARPLDRNPEGILLEAHVIRGGSQPIDVELVVRVNVDPARPKFGPRRSARDPGVRVGADKEIIGE